MKLSESKKLELIYQLSNPEKGIGIDTMEELLTYLNDWCGVYIANWFEKEHIEALINEEMTEDEFDGLRYHMDNDLIADKASEAMRDEASFALKEIRKIKKERSSDGKN